MNNKNDKMEEYENNSNGDFGSDSESDFDFDIKFDDLLCRMF